VLAAVRHPGLAACLDQGTLPDGRAYLIRSWIEGPDLASWARDGPQKRVGALATKLCAALEHLHSRGFVHGDLKASNVIVRSGQHGTEPVLTDFGCRDRPARWSERRGERVALSTSRPRSSWVAR
jgi:serine/threonine-protein kinase